MGENADQHRNDHDDEELVAILDHLAIENQRQMENRSDAPWSKPWS